MKSHLLPACRTDAMVLRDTRALIDEGCVVCDTPACRDTYYGHRLVLDAPPTDPEAWFARWQAAHGDKGVGRAYLVWEHRALGPVPVPAGAELVRHRVMMHDLWEDPTPPSEALRPLTEADATALFALQAEEFAGNEAGQRYARWYLDQLWAHRSEERAVLWGAFADGALVGTCSIVWDRAEARLQNVLVAAPHRRQGIGSALVRAALGSYRERAMGIAYLVTEADSGAEAMYRGLDFRHVTWFWELSRPTASGSQEDHVGPAQGGAVREGG